MTTDPVPQHPSEFSAVPEYFNNDYDDNIKKEIQFNADRFDNMDESEQVLAIEDTEYSVRESFTSRGLTLDKIDEIIKGLRTGNDVSQLKLDERAGLSDDEIDAKYDTVRGYDTKPSELLNDLCSPGVVLSSKQFEALAPDVQWMYIFATRVDVMRLLNSGSSYSELSKYGRFPDIVISQEAELYTGIINNIMDNVTSSDAFQQAAEKPRFLLNCGTVQSEMLPSDISLVGATDSAIADIFYDNMPLVQVEYLQAAADQLRKVSV